MMRYTQGNLLDAQTEAVVNTVNTVGIMGKGVALMFKEAFPENFEAYASACARGEIRVGQMFVTANHELTGPRWIVNFPTKQHWRHPTKQEWVREGLVDLRRFILEKGVRSIALPPLGCGNGGLEWTVVRPMIESALGDLREVEVIAYEPTDRYQNQAKRSGVDTLTPARALVAELIRRYWLLGIECTLLEIQKLAWFLQRRIEQLALEDPLRLRFQADKYGPYADGLRHLLDALDGSYLRCEKRISDASPLDTIAFNESKREELRVYLAEGGGQAYVAALNDTEKVIDGFQTPLGMELLATVDWLLVRGCAPTLADIKTALRAWPAGEAAAARKLKLFDDRLLELALGRLTASAA